MIDFRPGPKQWDKKYLSTKLTQEAISGLFLGVKFCRSCQNIFDPKANKDLTILGSVWGHPPSKAKWEVQKPRVGVLVGLVMAAIPPQCRVCRPALSRKIDFSLIFPADFSLDLMNQKIIYLFISVRNDLPAYRPAIVFRRASRMPPYLCVRCGIYFVRQAVEM